VYTFLTVLHAFVCIFLMLVVLLQAGRGGGIGLAFGGGGGSQSVFGSSGGATFLTKMTAVCAFIFFANSLALAYLSSQSDSRRLQKIAEKKALSKKSEETANAKMLTEIEKRREAKAKAAAQTGEGEGAPTEGTAGEEKTPAAEENPAAAEEKTAVDKPAAGLKLTMPGRPGAPAGGKLAADLKLEKLEKPAVEKKAEKPAKRAVEKKPAAEKKAAPEDKPAAEEEPAAEKKAAAKKPAAENKAAERSGEKPATE
jgi:preprotein translocase subunit SecG